MQQNSFFLVCAAKVEKTVGKTVYKYKRRCVKFSKYRQKHLYHPLLAGFSKCNSASWTANTDL